MHHNFKGKVTNVVMCGVWRPVGVISQTFGDQSPLLVVVVLNVFIQV